MAAKPKTKTKAKTAAPRAAPALPGACKALLSKKQIAHALFITTRYLESMISRGDYPKSDLYLGSMQRWKVETHNAWVDKQGPIHARGVQAES